MKNKSYIGISFIILVFGIIFIPRIIDRIQGEEVVKSNRLGQAAPKEIKASTGELSYVEVNGEKRKAPNFQLVNQNGDTITNKDMMGKVYVAEFFFTSCPTICPVMKNNLKAVQKEVGQNENFGILSFTIDPKTDTPEVLKAYAGTHEINNPNWHFLTGAQDSIYKIANEGFYIYANEDQQEAGGFAHAGMFALVDQEGYIRSRKDAFGNPIVYYRGSIDRNKSVAEGEEEPEIDILIEDIKNLL